MIFNSITFLVFISIFIPIYFYLKGKLRLLFVLASSYLFYGWWDWRFLSLIVISTLIDYTVGLKLDTESDPIKRKTLLLISIVANLGILGFFKYFNFFADSLVILLNAFNIQLSYTTLHIVLPVGISFYTFQSMSYTIDVYYKKIPTERSLLKFSTYIAFFPQLVAGPIVRAKDFIPQLYKDHKPDFNNITRGIDQIMFGFFKKVVVADSISMLVDNAFASPDNYNSLQLVLVSIFYTFQVYCDFSGYSDVAIGLAKVMGFEFPMNFNYPYISKSFKEFWSRWHISLSTWLKDYLYIPLGGNRHGKLKTYRNLFLTMLLGGLWHGAAWNFVIWGSAQGTFLAIEKFIYPYTSKMLAFKNKHLILLKNIFLMLFIYALTVLSFMVFRTHSLENYKIFMSKIFIDVDYSLSNLVNKFWIIKDIMIIILLIGAEILYKHSTIKQLIENKIIYRAIYYSTVMIIILFLGTFSSNQFIYFQF